MKVGLAFQPLSPNAQTIVLQSSSASCCPLTVSCPGMFATTVKVVVGVRETLDCVGRRRSERQWLVGVMHVFILDSPEIQAHAVGPEWPDLNVLCFFPAVLS
jgi:hypothetical protein